MQAYKSKYSIHQQYLMSFFHYEFMETLFIKHAYESKVSTHQRY